ncbi:hormone-sensitive lipase-like [Gigantopelta aegis]|uniref:hormone-sensitive lipase-like n=1 Tax=Gigantopelta aegis TaxID=1735272 RepID=UPI001B88C8A3|nr:hormone-sensitive lipase-like [Gigantopelta aegis]
MATENSYECPYRFLTSVIKELKCLALANMEYFQNGSHSHHAKFHTSFCLLYEYLDIGIEPIVIELFPQLSGFDASPDVKGNGYRSLLKVIHKCCLHLVQLLRHITINRDSMLFRRANYCKEVEAYVATLGQLRACLYYAQKLMSYCTNGNLFADEDSLNNNVAEQLLSDVETLNEDCFYGRCLGFQFCYSMQRPLIVVAIAMASFSEGYQENSQIMKLATSIFSSGKYLFNPELRAQQVVNITRSADVNFCKAFWGITETEIMKQLPSLVCPVVQVNEVLLLGPDSFEMPTSDNSDVVVITPPCAHTGPGSVQVRLISVVLREGQEVHLKKQGGKLKPDQKTLPRTPGLLVHCHGGGFVAQSSRSHEVYLRHWAKELNVPILSIDYSLAPEFPFPRALEECFYAYAWAVQNVEKLGSTGERICVAGDSAGGNLMISTAMRAAAVGIRVPDGIMAAYTPVMVRYTPSPSRLLTLMDPLLPVGILSRCLAAYAGVSDKLATGLASTVFPGEDDGAVNLLESSSDEWIVVSQEELQHNRTKVKIESHNTQVKVRSDSERTLDETQVKVRPDAERTLDETQIKVHPNSGRSPDETQVKVRSDSERTPDETPVKVRPDAERTPDETQVKVHPDSGRTPDETQVKVHPVSKNTPDEMRDKVHLVSEKASDDTQVKVHLDSVEHSDNSQVKIHLDLLENSDDTPVKVRLDSDRNRHQTPVKVPVLLQEYSNDLQEIDSDAPRKKEELFLKNNVDDSQLSSANSSVSLEVHLSTLDSASIYEDLDKSSAVSSNSLPTYSIAVGNLLHATDRKLPVSENQALASNEHFTDVALNNTPLEENNSYTNLIGEYEIVNKETIPVCNSIESRSSSPSELSYSDHEPDGQVDISVAKLVCSVPKTCKDADTKVKTSRQSGERLPNLNCFFSTNKETKPKNNTSGCHGDNMGNSCASASGNIHRPNRELLNLDLAAGDAWSKKHSPSRLNRSPSTPTFKKMASPPQRTPGPTDFARHRHHGQSPLQAMRHLPIARNPYMSPLLAPSHMLQTLPHVCLVACHLDPILDDSVMFAKKLHRLGKSVDLHLIDNLPHGFLNFALVSKEAKQASDVCVAKIRKVLNMD